MILVAEMAQYFSIRATKVTLSYSLRIRVSCGKLPRNSEHLWVLLFVDFVCYQFGLFLNEISSYLFRLVFAEHRYYGQSKPFGNKSFTDPEYSGYLSSQQALADYADLLSAINTKHRPVIVFGGSYGGMLAAWMRMKYPHLVTGAIASSAPILQFTADCNRFNTILTSVFSAGHRSCSKNIKESWNVIKWVDDASHNRNRLELEISGDWIDFYFQKSIVDSRRPQHVEHEIRILYESDQTRRSRWFRWWVCWVVAASIWNDVDVIFGFQF